MSQAKQLLDSLTEGAVYTARPEEEPHIVVGEDRFITVPDELKRIAVQGDHNIETVTFDCPRYWDGHDLSTMKVYVHYRIPDGRKIKYWAKDAVPNTDNPNIINFTWTISKNVARAAGFISFIVCIKNVVKVVDNETGEESFKEVNHWNSEINQEMYVSAGLEEEGGYEDIDPDIEAQLLERMDIVEESIDAADVLNAKGFYDETVSTINASFENAKTYVENQVSALEENVKTVDAQIGELISGVTTSAAQPFTTTNYILAGEYPLLGNDFSLDIQSNGVDAFIQFNCIYGNPQRVIAKFPTDINFAMSDRDGVEYFDYAWFDIHVPNSGSYELSLRNTSAIRAKLVERQWAGEGNQLHTYITMFYQEQASKEWVNALTKSSIGTEFSIRGDEWSSYSGDLGTDLMATIQFDVPSSTTLRICICDMPFHFITEKGAPLDDPENSWCAPAFEVVISPKPPTLLSSDYVQETHRPITNLHIPIPSQPGNYFDFSVDGTLSFFCDREYYYDKHLSEMEKDLWHLVGHDSFSYYYRLPAVYTSDPMIDNLCVDVDGKVHNTPGEAVRSQVNELHAELENFQANLDPKVTEAAQHATNAQTYANQAKNHADRASAQADYVSETAADILAGLGELGNIAQTTGDSEFIAMSQKATTRIANAILKPCDLTWTAGGIAGATGFENAQTSNRIRSNFVYAKDLAVVYMPNVEYQMGLFLYDMNRKYIGSSTIAAWTNEVDIDSVLAMYPECEYVRLAMRQRYDVNIDTTAAESSGLYLTRSDCKKLNDDVAKLNDMLAIVPVRFKLGVIQTANGVVDATSKTRCCSDRVTYDDKLNVSFDSQYDIYLHFYSGDTYLGNSGSWLSTETALATYAELGADSFALNVRKKDDSVIPVEEVEVIQYSVVVYSQNSVIFKIHEMAGNSSQEEDTDSHDSLGIQSFSFQLGAISSGDGIPYPSTTRCYSNPVQYSKDMVVRVDKDVEFYLFFYDGDTYVGNNGGWTKDMTSLSVYEHLGATSYRIVVRTLANDTITEDSLSRFSYKVIAYLQYGLFADLSAGAENKFDYTTAGLPVLELTGDTALMTKDNAVTLNFTYGTLTGTCTCKWQGSSSVRLGYPKRNYTIKFDNGFEAKTGWGIQKKYCMKANWIDPSGTRNVVNARLWGQVVASRGNAVTDGRATAPNYGAIDGFPIIIAINGKFEGLYTFNIPKDAWMFGMGEGTNEYMVVSEHNTLPACQFKGLAVCNEEDYTIEHKPDDIADSDVVASFNALIQATINAGADWETTLAPYLDIDSVIDYFIFVNCIGGHDNLGKNIIYATYDGTKWFMSAYDLDTTYGSNPYGKPTEERPTAWYKVVNDRNQFKEASTTHRLAYLVYNYSKTRLKARYQELRESVLSDENVWYIHTNFVNDIPRNVYNADAEKWPTMPATSTANTSTYMDFYRMHCAYLDKEVEAMS